MVNLSRSVIGNATEVQQDLLDPEAMSIEASEENPSEIGMSGDGNLSALSRNVAGLIDYVQVLVAGGGGASKVNGPMGNKFFLKTGAKCKDTQSRQER